MPGRGMRTGSNEAIRLVYYMADCAVADGRGGQNLKLSPMRAESLRDIFGDDIVNQAAELKVNVLAPPRDWIIDHVSRTVRLPKAPHTGTEARRHVAPCAGLTGAILPV